MSQPGTPVPRTSWWIRGALIVSLALNLLVIGALVGAALRGPMTRGNALSFAQHYISALPPELRRHVIRSVRQSDVGRQMRRPARAAAQAEIIAALKADPFDMDSLKMQVTDQTTQALALQGEIKEAWLSAVAKMDAPARRAYADALAAQARKKPGHKRP